MISTIERALTILPKPIKRRLRKQYTKLIYHYFTKLHKGRFKMRFMNLGYVDSNPPILEERELNEQLSINLYHALFKEVDIVDKSILEIGCGKGGGCFYALKYLKAKLVIGIDLVKSNIEQCKKLHKYPEVAFKVMDAETFSLEDTFDVVVNLESSHCYYYRNLFVERVTEALKPDGHFMYSDFMRPEDFLEMESYFKQSGLDIIKKEDITQNVIDAILLMENYKEEVLNNSSVIKYFYKNFAVTTDSEVYKKFKKGELVYLKYVLIKQKK